MMEPNSKEFDQLVSHTYYLSRQTVIDKYKPTHQQTNRQIKKKSIQVRDSEHG